MRLNETEREEFIQLYGSFKLEILDVMNEVYIVLKMKRDEVNRKFSDHYKNIREYYRRIFYFDRNAAIQYFKEMEMESDIMYDSIELDILSNMQCLKLGHDICYSIYTENAVNIVKKYFDYSSHLVMCEKEMRWWNPNM